MQIGGHDETKRRLLQLSEHALKTDSSQNFTCDIIRIKYYYFVSVMPENPKILRCILFPPVASLSLF